jgi:hypothetical protein
MGNSLYERTSGTGLFSTGSGASQRGPDVTPTAISSTSPSGNPPLAFEVTATRTDTGIVMTHFIQRTDTQTTLMRYSYTDTSPNNNGITSGSDTNADTGYNPVFNTVGFAFARGYIGTTVANAQFSNIKVSFQSGITPQPQTITFTAPEDLPFGSPPIALSATASSGLPVSFTVLSGSATLSGNTLTLIGAGAVTLRASQAGDANFLAAADVDRSFLVTKALATLTLGNLNQTYDGTGKSATTTTDPAPDLEVEIRYDGELTEPYQIGSYGVTAAIVDDNYEGTGSGTLVISPAYTALENWRFIHFESYDNTGDAADLADPDFDGIANLMEFALGLDPGQASTIPAILDEEGNVMSYTLTRLKAAVAELDFTVEHSESLLPNSWLNTNVEEVSPPLADDGILETVRFNIPTTGERHFIRLKVTSKSTSPLPERR